MKFFLVTFLCIIFSVSIMAQDLDREQRIKNLQEKILQQQEVLQNLQTQVNQKENLSKDYTKKYVDEYLNNSFTQKDEVGITAGYDNGFFIQSADSNFRLKVNGYVMTNAYFYEVHTSTNNRFRLTSARVDFNIYLFNDWHVRIRPDFAADGDLREAYVEYLGLDYFKIRAGAFITPFSMIHNISPADLIVAGYYSPLLSNVPLRDVGVMIFGNGLPFLPNEIFADHLSYAMGIFNGEGMNNTNVSDEFLYVVQTRFYPLTTKEKNVYFHAAFMTGNTLYRSEGSDITLGAFGGHEVFDGDLSADDDGTKGRTLGVTGAFRYLKDNLRVECEYIWMRYDRKEDYVNISDRRHALDKWGISFGLSYFIPISDTDKHNGVEPLFKCSYTTIDDIDGAVTGGVSSESDVTGQDIWEIIFGAKYHFNKHVLAAFNWAMYDLAETRGLTNSSRGEGGGLLHAFIFQCIAKW